MTLHRPINTAQSGFQPTSRKKTVALALAPLASLQASAALAQNADALPKKTKPTDILVVSATRTPTPIEQVGVSVSVIDATLIAQRQYTSVNDVLRDTAGVSIARNGGLGAVSSARVRGAGSGQTLVVVDGIVLNDPSAPQGGFNFATLDLVDVEKIEVLRGPQSLIYGADAIGGVVSIHTKQNQNITALNGFAEGGSRGFARGGASLSLGDAALNGRFTVSGATSDGISRAASGRESDGFRSIAGSFTGAARLADNWQATLYARYSDARSETDGFPPPNFTLADSDDSETSTEIATAARLAYCTSCDASHTLTFGYNSIDRENFSGNTSTFTGEGDRISLDYFARFSLSDTIVVQGGTEIERVGVDVSDINQSADAGAIYGLVEVEPVSGFFVTAGVRRDEFERFDGATSARLTAAYAVTPSTTIRASWGQGFRAPSLFELNFNFLGLPPNPDLAPERSNGFDASLEQRFGLARLKVTGFHQKVRDQIDFDFTSGGYINIDRTRSRGIEIEADWPLNDIITLSANYSLIDIIDRSTDQQLLRQPKHSGAFFVDLKTPLGLGLGASLVVNGDERDIDDFGGPLINDGFVRLDLRANYPVSDAIEVYSRIENVTDTDYQDIAGFMEPGISAFGGLRIRL